MQTEDGPYRNTRSSTGSVSKNLDSNGRSHSHGSMNDEVFEQSNFFQNSKKSSEEEIQQINERPRTPSGHLMSNSVGKIRNFFLQTETTEATPVTVQRVKGSTNTQDKNRKKPKSKTIEKPENQPTLSFNVSKGALTAVTTQLEPNKQQNYADTGESANASVNASQRTADTQDQENFGDHDNSFINGPAADITPGISVNCNHPSRNPSQQIMSQSAQPINTNQRDDEDQSDLQEEPKVMDLRIVLQMFQELRGDVRAFNEFKKEVDTNKLKKLIDSSEEDSKAVTLLQEQLEQQKEKNKVMSGTIQRMSQVMNEMNKRITNLEKSSNKESLVLSNFPFVENRRDRHQQLKDFFQDTLKAKVNIQDTFYIGNEGARSVVIKFSNLQERNKVFFNKKNLKDYTDENDKSFYISEVLPAELQEKTRREREIFGKNKRNTATAIEMSFVRGNLRIQNEPYQPKVRVPEPQDFLSLKDEELKEVMSVSILAGERLIENATSFTGYVAKATSFNHIRKAYLRMKLALPQARHIMCAYKIDAVEEYYAENSCDDGEYAGGRTVLQAIKDRGIKNCAIFVVRFNGGNKLGQRRFELIKQAAESALDRISTKQKPKSIQPAKKPDMTQQKNPDKTRYTFKQQGALNTEMVYPSYSAALQSPTMDTPKEQRIMKDKNTARKLSYEGNSNEREREKDN